jgi:hypothetical protein
MDKGAWTGRTTKRRKRRTSLGPLEPVLYPPDTLYGIKDFQTEVGFLRLVLPNPGLKGEIDSLSLPPAAGYMDGDEIFGERQNNYAAMLFTHPLRM